VAQAAVLDTQAATNLADKIDKLVGALNTPRPNRTEDMLNQQQPPGLSTNYNKDSKPFSLHQFLSGYKAKNDHTLCSHEYDVLRRYNKALEKTNCALTGVAGGLWLPMDMNETYSGKLTSTSESEADYNYVKAVMDNTRPAVDPDELAWLERRKYVKAQSAFQDSVGGSLVTPPVQGATIPLIRPNAAFLAAGAQAITLPPNGRMVMPRVTGAPDVQAVGESQETPESDLTTGFMELTSKKIAGAVRMTEEASAYTSGTMDAIAQGELGRSLGLRMDAYAFYGIGSTQIPAGLTANVYAGQVLDVTTFNPTALGIGANGNTLLPQYGDIFPSLIEERSFGVAEGITGAWIMRPAVYASAVASRASAVTPNDQQGPMVDILRRFEQSGPNVLKGRRVVRTTNLRNNRSKGSATNLSDCFFGVWSYAIMASYGAMNFQQGHNGVTFMKGQILIRGTMFGDIGYQYPEAFLWYKDVAGLTGTW
jgi:HK97 family phage major capsid protein